MIDDNRIFLPHTPEMISQKKEIVIFSMQSAFINKITQGDLTLLLSSVFFCYSFELVYSSINGGNKANVQKVMVNIK